MDKGYVITDEEMVDLVQAVSAGALSKPYAVETIVEKILPRYMIAKSEMISIYFDDILNTCEDLKEVKIYINELIKEWE